MSAGRIEAQFQLRWPGFELDVALDLPARGVSALFGPSGSGKTSVLRCLAGLDRASPGRLLFEGSIWQDASHWLPTHQRPLGYVFQEAHLFEHLTVLGNLQYGLRRRRAAPHDLEQAIVLLGIDKLLPRKPDRLSGGERQRVAIARALAAGPRLLLMDEPLAALDEPRKREVLPYLERLTTQSQIPIVYVSHAAEEVARLADHLVLLDQGKVSAAGPLAATLARLDLPSRPGSEAMTVHAGQIGALDPQWHLARVDFAGGSLWLSDPQLPIGRPVRVRILARDVSLALQPGNSSIQNVWPGRVEAIGADAHPALCLVQVRVGSALLLARLTRRAVATLAVQPGLELWVQVKSAALLD